MAGFFGKESSYEKQSCQHLSESEPPSDNCEPQCALNILQNFVASYCSSQEHRS